MSWRDITVLPCGCKLQQYYDHAAVEHNEVHVHPVDGCTIHLCRVCGAVPLADYEPDRLCENCAERR